MLLASRLLGSKLLPLQSAVAPHQFKKAQRVADGMNATHFIRINRADRHRVDPETFPAGDDQHFGFVVETRRAAEQFGNQLSMYHSQATLIVRNFLTAN